MVGPEPASDDVPPPIATPDQRLRVFVSSTIEELAEERRAVRTAVTRMRLTPVLFELGARPHPPRDLYRAYLAQSDVFVGIYGEHYGWTAPGMTISGLEDEFELSAGMPRLLYLRRDAPGREPRLTELITRIQAEGGASTTPYEDPEQLAELVADDLAVLLTERFAEKDAPHPGLSSGWLPTPPTPMVDREAELALVTGMLADPAVRLVTLTGPGGTGKTRLALAVAERVVPDRDAVWWIDLAPLRDPREVPVAVAAALGVTAEGRRPLLDLVAERLAGLRVLLVVDNAEQVLDAAPSAAALLARCPHTQLLVTSRSVVGLRGEHDVPLGPLAVPDAGEARPDRVGAAPAVELFVARAQQAAPSFAVTPESAAAVAELVRRLDGLPLAVELAAARVRALPPALLLRRLGRALDLRAVDVDAPDRQRTLRDTIAWSHDLLSEAERALLARLSVCAGGCTLDTAEAVGARDDDLDVVDTLSELVAHSLVTSSDPGAGEPRFRMLGLVRAFAAERLRERGEEEATRERLAMHLADLSAEAGAGLSGPEHGLWLARLEAEAADLEAALRWAVDHDRAELAVRLAAPLARWWWARGLLAVMAELAERTAGLPSAAHLPPDLAGLLLWARGATRVALGRVEEARPLLERLVEDARARGDQWLLGHGLNGLAMTLPPGDAELAPTLDAAVAALRASGDTWSVAFALLFRGAVAVLGDAPAEATGLHREALDLARTIGDEHLAAAFHDQLALDALMTGDLPTVRDSLAEAAELHRQLRDLEGLAYCLDGLAALALALGEPAMAARLAGSAAAARRELGVAVWPPLQPLARRLSDAIAEALGPDEDRRERAAGARLDPWTALDEGLATVRKATPVSGSPPG
ncbi:MULTISPECIES: ATP-binding protein [unclassified Geodermatophilus]|uniref:ATP-binding protein n=1 Tax=unclassified Geodermatophilus TaxID=2637632 RepID=UPI003EECA149